MLPRRWNPTEKGGAFEIARGIDLDVKADRRFTLTNFEHQGSISRRSAAFHLPEVCRQIYAEAALLSYTQNNFVCYGYPVGRNHPAARLMAAQRRAITSIQPTPRLVHDMMAIGKRILEGIRKVWPNVQKILLTSDAFTYVRSYHERFALGEKTTWSQNQWLAWMLDCLKPCQEVGVDIVLEEGLRSESLTIER